MKPKVSIITPLYNSENYIADTIESVLKQAYTHWEMIVVNDCSSDGSLQKVYAYLSDHRIRLINNSKNSGVAFTRNQGIEAAKGQYIAFLDADDLWAPQKLEVQVAFMELNGHLFSYTSYQKVDSERKIISAPIAVLPSVTYHQLLKNNDIGCLTAMYDCEALGKFYFQKVGHEDFVYWLQILKNNIKAHSINKPLAYYRVHNNTLSSNKWVAVTYTWNIYRDIEKLGFFSSSYYFFNYAIKSFFKFLK